MGLTEKLLGYLHRVFDKDPRGFLAIRLRYSGTTMTWEIAAGVLTTSVTGGAGDNLSIDLSEFTLRELVSELAAQPGYTVEYADTSELADLSALTLIEGAGDQDASNGDHLRAYTSLLWSYLGAAAQELRQARLQIAEMLQQMEIPSADTDWLDELGGYYGIPRRVGESDAYYSQRIIVEVLRPRGNNIAIENAIEEVTGQEVAVTDVILYSGSITPLYDGAIDHDGIESYDAAALPIYGLFDVVYAYDLEGGPDISEYVATVQDLVNTLRDAGTHMRSFTLSGGVMVDAWPGVIADSIALEATLAFADTVATPTDTVEDLVVTFALADTVAAQADDLTVVENSYHTYNGAHDHGGTARQTYYNSLAESIYQFVSESGDVFVTEAGTPLSHERTISYG